MMVVGGIVMAHVGSSKARMSMRVAVKSSSPNAMKRVMKRTPPRVANRLESLPKNQ